MAKKASGKEQRELINDTHLLRELFEMAGVDKESATAYIVMLELKKHEAGEHLSKVLDNAVKSEFGNAGENTLAALKVSTYGSISNARFFPVKEL